jgi:hypothetical protein
MVAYVLPKDRYTPVVQGAQRFIILPPRKPGKPRHAHVGEAITLRPGGVTLGAARCVARATLIITRTGLNRVLVQGAAVDQPSIVRRAQAAENGSPNAEREAAHLAADLGFPSWAALWRDQRDREGATRDGRADILTVELIGWEPLEAEAA